MFVFKTKVECLKVVKVFLFAPKVNKHVFCFVDTPSGIQIFIILTIAVNSLPYFLS